MEKEIRFSDKSIILSCDNAARFLRKLRIPSDEHEKFLVDSLITIFDDISANPDIYDEQCKCNIEWVGRSFVNNISEIASTSPSESLIEATVALAYRFLSERNFNVSFSYPSPIGLVYRDITDSFSSFRLENQREITYANYVMPAHIFKKIMAGDEFSLISDFSSNVKKFEDLKAQSEVEIKNREKSVEILKSTLEGYKNAFNFVGLSAGFQSLLNRKKVESNFAYAGLVLFGLAMILIPILEFKNVNSKVLDAEVSTGQLFVLGVPYFAIELIFIYFFRVVLNARHSINKQILQLELRMTLCQFIQSYVDYSEKIKIKDKNALDKFENLIFSGIVSDEQNLPSTFDGIEQISKLIDAVKKSK